MEVLIPFGVAFAEVEDQGNQSRAIFVQPDVEQPHAYVVTERVTFREVLVSDRERNRNKRWIGPFPDERVTLFTCHPAWTNAGRLIVVGKPLR